VIPIGTHVRVLNTFNDRCLEHVQGFTGTVVYTYFLPKGERTMERRYVVCVHGLDYELSKEEIEIV
jgi:hypothetical protein